MSEAVLFGLGAVLASGYLIQTVTGFGAMIVSIALGALFLEIEEIVAIAIPLSLAQNVFIVARHHRGIHRGLLFKTILPVMGLGMVGGFFVSEYVEGDVLRIAFGLMVLALAARELTRATGEGAPAPKPLGRIASGVAVLGAGLIHGIYVTGGPLLVYAIGRLELGKHVFRSTITAVWLLLNTVLLGMFVYAGRVNSETATHSAWLLLAVPVGIGAGEWVHHRVDEARFRRALFAVLAIAAVVLIIR